MEVYLGQLSIKMGGNVTSNDYYYFKDVNTELLAKYFGALAAILPLVAIFVKFLLRPRVLVNCWFCNTNSRVAREKNNSWYCSNCEQYNGFLPSGDYNKEIPEQHAFSGGSGITYASKSRFPLDSNGLCDTCNAHQEMKVKHLATFEASVPSNYDEELKIYRNQLENAYRLCQKCENVVVDTLEKKKQVILGLQLKQSEKRTLEKLKLLRYSCSGLLRGLLVTMASLFSLMFAAAVPLVQKLDLPLIHIAQKYVQSNYCNLLAGNLLVQLLLTWNTGRKLPFTVTLGFAAAYFSRNQWGTGEAGSYTLGCLSGLIFFLTLLSLKKVRRGALVKIHKVEKPSIQVRRYEKDQQRDVLPKANGQVFRNHRLPPSEEAAVIRCEKADFPQALFISSRDRTAKPSSVEPPNQNTVSTQCQDDSSSVDSAFSNHDSATLDTDSVKDDVKHDVNSMIGSLNLGAQRSSKSVAEPGPRHEFQSRRYGRNEKPLINPARLVSTSPKSLNESSWVAGGFWQKQPSDLFSSGHSPPSDQCSRPGSPAPSVYSQASSAWHSSMSRPSTPPPSAMFDPTRMVSPFPMYTPPYGPPNGFHPPMGFQPYMYGPPMSPVWNSSMFQPISPAQNSTSSHSCSSASTCGSVRRRRWENESVMDFASVSSSSLKPKHRNVFQALWDNSAIIFYTSAFYVAVTASVFFFHRW